MYMTRHCSQITTLNKHETFAVKYMMRERESEREGKREGRKGNKSIYFQDSIEATLYSV